MYTLYKASVHSVQRLCTIFASIPRERRSDAVYEKGMKSIVLCGWKKTWFRCEVGPFDPEFRRPFGTLEIGWDISDKPPLTPP